MWIGIRFCIVLRITGIISGLGDGAEVFHWQIDFDGFEMNLERSVG